MEEPDLLKGKLQTHEVIKKLLPQLLPEEELNKLGGSSFVDTFIKTIDKMMPNAMPKGVSGGGVTAIPYYYSVVGELLINPTTVSISTFQRMIYSDDVIGTNMEYLSSTIESRIGLFYHENEEIQEFGRTMFKHKLKGGKRQLVKFMNSRHWAGFFMGEKKYRFDSSTSMWNIVEVVPAPPATLMVRVDGTGNVINKGGVLQFQFNFIPGVTNNFSYFGPGYPNAVNYFNSSAGATSNGSMGAGYIDPLAEMGDADFPIRSYVVPPYYAKPIDYDKLVHITYDIGDGFYNPYGRSMLRRIYNLYVLKYAIWQLFLIALDRRGTPLTVVYADAQRELTNRLDTNNEHPQTAVDYLADLGTDIHSTSLLVLPGKKGETFDVQAVPTDADLNIFQTILSVIDADMNRSMFIPSSISGGETGASYALGMSQGSFFDKLVKARTEEVTDVIINQIMRDVIIKNFDESEHKNDFGRFQYKALSLEEQMKLAKIIESIGTPENPWISSQDLGDLNEVRSAMDFEKVSKAFEPLISPLGGEDGPPGANMRPAKNAYKNQSEDKI
jgi:hypothetical protein